MTFVSRRRQLRRRWPSLARARGAGAGGLAAAAAAEAAASALREVRQLDGARAVGADQRLGRADDGAFARVPGRAAIAEAPAGLADGRAAVPVLRVGRALAEPVAERELLVGR